MPDNGGTNGTTNLTIPRWFLVIASTLMMAAVPWTAWVTVQLITIGVRASDYQSLSTIVTQHTSDIQTLKVQFPALEIRVHELENEARQGRRGGGPG